MSEHIPVLLFTLYRRFLNILRLVSFSPATVLVTTCIGAFSCVAVKALTTKRYLQSFLYHFTPSRVNPDQILHTTFERGYASTFEWLYRNTHVRGHVWAWRAKCHRWWGFDRTEDWTYERDSEEAIGLARMICILEILRFLMRPVSLSLRLVANISCRHILIVLAAGCSPTTVHIFTGVPFVCILETLVCFIQGYVFFTLWSMYMKE